VATGSAVEYFVSAYLAEPGEHSVLSPRHDQGVALWRSSEHAVELVRMWEAERLSGQKHHDWPLFTAARAEAFLTCLLASEGLSLNEISCLWGTPGLPRYQRVPPPSGAHDLPRHSLAHLFSGLLLDTRLFKEETIIAMATDGGPDFVEERRYPERWYAGCTSRQGRLDFRSVASPAPLYGAATALFMREPGTLMALASACRAEMKIDAEAMVSSLNLYGGRLFPMTVAVPFIESLIAEAQQLAPSSHDSNFSRTDNIQSAVMSAVQECCEVIAARNVRLLCFSSRTDPRDSYLSVSGGFALNCPANSRLMEEFGFRGLLVPPCADDSGQALGLGLMGLHAAGMFRDRDFRFTSAFHGNPLRDSDAALREFSPWITSISDFSGEQFVQDISGSLVAWVDGEAEVGPRALGHRSLLGDPRTARTKDQLNQVKQRQWWRPVAPIVMSAHAAEWFELSRPSPYMLEVAWVRDGLRGRVPAIVHLDGSARLQSLDPGIDPRLNDALDAFRRATGVPMLCNTSLNDKGEPIVDTAAEALTFCVRKGIAVIYLGGRRIGLRGHTDPEGGGPEMPARPRAREGRRFFEDQEASRDVIWNGWLDRGYSEDAMFVLSFMPGLRDPKIGGPDRVNGVARRFTRRRPAFTALADRYRGLTGPGASFSTGTDRAVARLFESG
jgi:carbamoyltransferase